VFKCEVGDDVTKYNTYDYYASSIKLIGPEYSYNELKQKAEKIEPDLGYKISHVLFPVNPLLLPKRDITERDIDNFHEWIRISNSKLTKQGFRFSSPRAAIFNFHDIRNFYTYRDFNIRNYLT